MASLPDENNLEYYVNSLEWDKCPICSLEFDDNSKFNKFNRDTHVKACIKRKKVENPSKKRKINVLEKLTPINHFFGK
jgi:hypothetical protein